MPILQTISFDDSSEIIFPEFKRLTFEEFHEVGGYKFNSITFEGEAIPLRIAVTERDGTPISGAICKVVSIDFEQEDETLDSGVVALDYVLGEVNTLTIKKQGYQTYTKSFKYDIFTEISWEIGLNKQVGVFIKTGGGISVNSKPTDPENNVIIT